MSISNKINSIRTHLEDDYTALEQLGVSVEDRNIENIKDMANQIYAKFPKTSYAEGSNITLSNTLKGKLDFEDGIVGYGDTKQEGTPTPDNPQDIEVVTGTIEVVERGINLLQQKLPTTTLSGITCTNNGDGSYTFSGTASANVNFRIDQSTTDGTDNLNTYKAPYTMVASIVTGTPTGKMFLGGYSDSESWSTPLCNIGAVRTVTSNINNAFCYIRFETGDVANETIYPMILDGEYTSSDIPNFEPYQTPQTYQLSLGEYEFAKIGNYVDTIEYDVDEDKVYKNEKIKKVVYTGASSEDWIKNAYGETYYRYTIVQSDIISATNTDNTLINAYSNYFGGTTAYKVINTHTDNMVGVISSNRIAISTSDSNLFEVNNFKTWLSTHNTKVYYVLATPTKTEITGTLKDQIKALYNSHSFTGTTIIEIDGQLPLIIKVRALKGE